MSDTFAYNKYDNLVLTKKRIFLVCLNCSHSNEDVYWVLKDLSIKKESPN